MSDAFSFTAGITLDLERFKRDLDKAAEYARAAFANLRLGLDGLGGVDVAFKKAWPKGVVLDMYENPVPMRDISRAMKDAKEEFGAAARSVGGMTEACDKFSKTAATAGAGLSRAGKDKLPPKGGGGPIEVKQVGGSKLTTFSFDLPAYSFIVNALKTPFMAAFENFASRESLAINLGTLLGDDERGAAFQKRLQDYAAHTPYAQNDLAGTAQTLLQYGASEDDAEKWLKQLGDISMGDRNKFSSLGLALGQVMSVGRLQGQDLLQMINAGFNPLSVIAEETGRSMAELKEAMSRGEIGFDQVAMALERATAEGGKFYQGAERGSKTFQGLISTITDNFSIALGTAVENNQGNFRAVLETWASFDWSAFIEGASGVFKLLSEYASSLSGFAATIADSGRAMKVISGIAKEAFGIGAFVSLVKFKGVLRQIAEAIAALTANCVGFLSKTKALATSSLAAAAAYGTLINAIMATLDAWRQLKKQEAEKDGRDTAQAEMDSGYAEVMKFVNKAKATKELYGEDSEHLAGNIEAAKEAYAKYLETAEKRGWQMKGVSVSKLNDNDMKLLGLKEEVKEEAKKAVAKAAKQDITYAPVTNNNTTNVTQNNEISSDFNDIGKLIRENLVEILRSQLTFRRDREEMAGAGA